MADVLGTVLGVVSLGLQVGASISNYLDGVQCRKEDMEYTTRCCKSMNSLLQQIKSLQYQLTGVNITAVREAMTTAEVELSILGNFVEKIRAGNNANYPNPIMKRAKKQKTKLLYPFQKDHLYRLNAQLDAANRALQAALLQVQLYPFHLYIYLSLTPLDTLAQNVGALDILLPDDSVTPLILQDAKMPPQNCDAEAMQAFRRASAISLKMRKAYEGHLMGAIVRQNKTMLLDILKKDANMSELSEMDPYGQKMLNYLVGWPEGLQIMVEHCGLASLQLLDQSQSTLLSSALSWSGKICIGYSPQGCSDDCPCANAVDLLVKAGKDSSLQFNLHDNWVNAMLGASVKARDLIIDELKIRREELKHLGLMHLTCDQIDRMDLKKKTVLDYYTRQVLEALDAKGVNVHPRCRTDLHATEWHLGVTSNEPSDKIWRKGASVYHILGYAKISGYSIGACELADSLYAKGFGDIDLPDINGLAPLAVNNFAKDNSSFHLLHRFLERYGVLMPTFDPRDICNCGCSVGGCSPYNSMWKTALENYKRSVYAGDTVHMMNFVRERTLEMEATFDFPRHIKQTWLRACTFAMLPLRHTCCCDGFQEHDDEGILEILEEDEGDLESFEVLMVELDRRWEELGCSLAEFYRLHWIDRMDEVLRQMDERMLTAEDIQNVKKLGIDLAVQPEPFTREKGSYENKGSGVLVSADGCVGCVRATMELYYSVEIQVFPIMVSKAK
ncbi:hypothetical protein CGCS363_v002477 [Colletotrichum siamense]|uniref:uncharacterized protein n=1 Tax=Colletotrichum siamense TaxID=690259 RepID=UPI001872783D|nr:uncharacterized protein CGCS363_v002477 [Colletotrichum siamense]KAF5510969.1 hypothetical protein CGCS363_v002477 [Colletotrichum siamense]